MAKSNLRLKIKQRKGRGRFIKNKRKAVRRALGG